MGKWFFEFRSEYGDGLRRCAFFLPRSRCRWVLLLVSREGPLGTWGSLGRPDGNGQAMKIIMEREGGGSGGNEAMSGAGG